MDLHAAIERGNTAEVRRLLAAGANANAHYVSNEGDTTPLVMAVERESPEIVQALIDAGARVNFKLDDGYTALATAVTRMSAPMVKALVEGGANPNLKLGDGNTAVDMARELRAAAHDEREQQTMNEILKTLSWVKRAPILALRNARKEARFRAHEVGGRRTRKTRRTRRTRRARKV